MARIGASVGLGVLAPPLALLPLIDLGDAPDADCRSLYQDARVHDRPSDTHPRQPTRGKAAQKRSRPATSASQRGAPTDALASTSCGFDSRLDLAGACAACMRLERRMLQARAS